MLILQKPHSEGQKNLITSVNNDVVFAGRRWGKTHTGVQRIIRSCLKRVGLHWWVGLGWKSASLKRAWRELKVIARAIWKGFDREVKDSDFIRESSKEIVLPNKSEIWMRTAERPDSLAGEGIEGAVLDEFTLMQEIVWTEYVEATLLDKGGWALFIGVPKGNNWGARLWRNCEIGPEGRPWSGTRKGWKAHHFPTVSNPFIDAKRVEEIREFTPASLYRQEYLAEILDMAGLVFTNIEPCIRGEQTRQPVPGRSYVFGLDWGKIDDFTVVSVMEREKKQLVNTLRFNDIDYPTQLSRIKELYTTFNPRVIIAEANSMGEPLCDQLISDGLPIMKFHMNNKSKRNIIEKLQVAFEQQDIGIIPDRDLLKELQEYEMEVTDRGNITFGAPSGGHDDCVISLALAYHECKTDSGITF